MNEWLSQLLFWLPFLLLIGVWVWPSRGVGMRARGRSGAAMIELYEQQVEETRALKNEPFTNSISPERKYWP